MVFAEKRVFRLNLICGLVRLLNFGLQFSLSIAPLSDDMAQSVHSSKVNDDHAGSDWFIDSDKRIWTYLPPDEDDDSDAEGSYESIGTVLSTAFAQDDPANENLILLIAKDGNRRHKEPMAFSLEQVIISPSKEHDFLMGTKTWQKLGNNATLEEFRGENRVFV